MSKGQAINIDFTVGLGLFLVSILGGLLFVANSNMGESGVTEARQKASLVQQKLEEQTYYRGEQAPLIVRTPSETGRIPVDRSYVFPEEAYAGTGSMDIPADIDIGQDRVVTVVDGRNSTHQLNYFYTSNSNISYSNNIETGTWMNNSMVSVKPGSPGLQSLGVNGNEILEPSADLNGDTFTVSEDELHTSTLSGDLKLYNGSRELILENPGTVTFDMKNFTTLYWHRDGSTTELTGTGTFKSGTTSAFTVASGYGVTFLGDELDATVSKPDSSTVRASIDAPRLRIRLQTDPIEPIHEFIAYQADDSDLDYQYSNQDGSFGTIESFGDSYSDSNTDGGIVIADFTGDGYYDIAHANSGNPDGGQNVYIWRNVADTPPSRPELAATTPSGSGNFQGMTPGDFDSDGDQDIVVVSGCCGKSPTWLVENTASGWTETELGSSMVARDVVSADFNEDGCEDLIGGSNGDASFWPGRCDGTFGSPTVVSNLGDNNYLAEADFNSDGHKDFAVNPEGNGSINLYLGEGDGAFQRDNVVYTTNGHIGLDAGDVDHDGDQDLVGCVHNNGGSAVSSNHGFYIENVERGNFSSPVDLGGVGGNCIGAAFPQDAYNDDAHNRIQLFEEGNIAFGAEKKLRGASRGGIERLENIAKRKFENLIGLEDFDYNIVYGEDINLRELAYTVASQSDWNAGSFNLSSADRKDNSGDLGIGYRNGTDGDNLIGYWRMDANVAGDGGTVTDYSGESNNGITKNGIESKDKGVYSTSYMFDGSHIDVNSPSSLPTGNSAFTTSFWIKDLGSNEGDGIIHWGSNSGNSASGQEIRNGGWQHYFYSNDLNCYGIGLEDGRWHLAVVRFNPLQNNRSMFLDGELKCSDSPGDVSVDYSEIQIGNGDSSGVLNNAKLDEIRIYNRSLSTSEIQQLYFDGRDGTFNGGYTSRRIDNSALTEWRKLQVNASVPPDTGVTATFQAISGAGGTRDTQVVSIQNGLNNYSLSVEDTEDARVSFSGTSTNVTRTWEIMSYRVFHEESKSLLDRGSPIPYQTVVVSDRPSVLLGRYGNYSRIENRVALWR
ncbi:MAG: FG-GAP-like repeat-containing protein [Candidatus Nanohaloarchaea archaeon]